MNDKAFSRSESDVLFGFSDQKIEQSSEKGQAKVSSLAGGVKQNQPTVRNVQYNHILFKENEDSVIALKRERADVSQHKRRWT